MDIPEFINQLGYKHPDDMVQNFSENLVVYTLLKGFGVLLEAVKVRKRKDHIQYVISNRVDGDLSQYRVSMHDKHYKIKTRKEKDDTIIEAHPYE